MNTLAFTYGPVDGKQFFGREKELDFLFKKLEDLKAGYRHNVAVLGKSLIGKSSLLLFFISTLDRTDLIPIYVDLAALPFASFIEQFIGMLLHYHYEGTMGEIKDDPALLLDAAALDLPKTHKKIKTIYSYVKTAKEKLAFEELLDLPSCFSAESGKFCVIVFDNFSKLADYNLGDPFSVLGDKIMLQKMSLYILADYPHMGSRNIVSEKLSLLFGKFHAVDLAPFNLCESLAFIDSRLKDLRLLDDYKKFLAHISGGEPFYLDILAGLLVARINEKMPMTISREDLCHIIYDYIYARYSPINQYFSRIVERLSLPENPKDAIKILSAVVRKNKIADIIEDSRCTNEQTHKVLDKFTTEEMVIKNGPLYAIEDEIFKLWLRFKEIDAAPQPRLDNKAYTERFINEISRLLEAFEKEQQKLLDNKILNLITSFDNEKVTVGKATHILPSFKHIHTECASEKDVFISAHGTKLWMFSVYKKLASEDDILSFINYCKKQKHNLGRKVLILLNDITPEAKLLAMEEHMWIWPLDRLNSLLNLYKKPKITIL